MDSPPPASETPTTSFTLKAKPARKLKLALASLCDPNFNPKGLGKIDVNESFFNITVYNTDTRVFGQLRLRAPHLESFYYREPLGKNMVNLNEVFKNLAVANDDDTVNIYHVLGSTQLSFEFGNDTTEEFSVELLESDADFREFPGVTIACEAITETRFLRDIISEMDGDKPQRVLVKITESDVNMTLGNKTWQHLVVKTAGLKSAITGEDYIGWFQWPHDDSLLNASRLETLFTISFLDDPLDSLMLRFFTRESWDLVYVKLYSTFARVPSSGVNLEIIPGPSAYICSFKFHLNPASALKAVLHSLTEDTFNRPPGLGMIEVNEKGFKIVARDSKTGVVGFIQLNAHTLTNFKCYQPFEKKMVNLEQIALKLFMAHDNDLVSIHHLAGSNEISFKTVGRQTTTLFSAELLEVDPEFKEFPEGISYACGADIPSEYLTEMIPLLVQDGKPQIVSVEIKDGLMTVSIGQQSWECDSDAELLGQNHHLCFEWPHSASLRWATSLADVCLLYILNDPPNSIMLRFTVHYLGVLVYVNQEALRLPES